MIWPSSPHEIRPTHPKRRYFGQQWVGINNSLVTGMTGRPPFGIDWIVSANNREFTLALREAIEQVAIRLWYKAPPPPRKAGGATANDVVLDYVRSAKELEESFRLRYKVYGILGYLEAAIRATALKIDVDAFDRDAIHLIARSVRTRKVVGCTRLIIPSRRISAAPEENIHFAERVPQWCDEIGDREEKQIVRRRLKNGTPLELPAASMAVYEQLIHNLRTKDCCELSRLIVDTNHRGLDLSSRMVEMAIKLMTCMGRKIMLLECAPAHRGFYESFGFEMPKFEGTPTAPAHQLGVHAITLWLQLSGQRDGAPKKPNLQLRVSSIGSNAVHSRTFTRELRRRLPLELWSSDIRAPENYRAQRVERKRMEPTDCAIDVNVTGGSHIEEIASAIQETTTETPGVSVSAQSDKGVCELFTSGTRPPDRNMIRTRLIEILQWTDLKTSNEPS